VVLVYLYDLKTSLVRINPSKNEKLQATRRGTGCVRWIPEVPRSNLKVDTICRKATLVTLWQSYFRISGCGELMESSA